MQARLIEQRKFTVLNRFGNPVEIQMELFQIQGDEALKYPEGYRFGWIAFDTANLSRRILFDSHPPKGAHFHVDRDEDGVPFIWESLKKAEETFFKMVCNHFYVDPKELE